MSYIIISVILIALSVFLLSFNILFRKNGKFPESEVGHNLRIRELGIKCAKAEERELWGNRRKTGKWPGVVYKPSSTCTNCSSCSCSTNFEDC